MGPWPASSPKTFQWWASDDIQSASYHNPRLTTIRQPLSNGSDGPRASCCSGFAGRHNSECGIDSAGIGDSRIKPVRPVPSAPAEAELKAFKGSRICAVEAYKKTLYTPKGKRGTLPVMRKSECLSTQSSLPLGIEFLLTLLQSCVLTPSHRRPCRTSRPPKRLLKIEGVLERIPGLALATLRRDLRREVSPSRSSGGGKARFGWSQKLTMDSIADRRRTQGGMSVRKDAQKVGIIVGIYGGFFS